jgi:hypothetical protein
MEILTLALMLLVNLMAKVSTSGQMEALILENLRKVSNMVRVGGKRLPCRIATNMRENTSMIKRMDMVFLIGKVVIYTKEVIKMTREMGMARCFGQMALHTQELG